ncbi:hypothetical protein BJ912DRAFT_925402 [Pholiota molesta]|nr:hypothetical protein BJ912DRAFT_925402 [Pholiota molesta]
MSILPLDDSCLRICFYPESWWTLAWVEGDQKERTSTSMEVAGATVFITFTSTYVSVCGTIPGSRTGQGPARASYNIDRGAPTAYVYLVLPDSKLSFQTSLLSPSLHTFITNLGGAGGAPYVVDFIPLSISNVLAERSHVEDLPLAMTTLTASGTITLSYSPTTTTVTQSVTVLQSAVETSSISQGKSAGFLASTVGGALGGIAFLVLIICFVVFLKKWRMLRDQDRTIPRPFGEH